MGLESEMEWTLIQVKSYNPDMDLDPDLNQELVPHHMI